MRLFPISPLLLICAAMSSEAATDGIGLTPVQELAAIIAGVAIISLSLLSIMLSRRLREKVAELQEARKKLEKNRQSDIETRV